MSKLRRVRPPLGCLTVLGGCGQDNVVGISRTQFLADVGFKLREREVRLRRKIFSLAESGYLGRILAIGKRCATREDLGPPAAPKSDMVTTGSGLLWISAIAPRAASYASGGVPRLTITTRDGSSISCLAQIWILNGETILCPITCRGCSNISAKSPGSNSFVQANAPGRVLHSMPSCFKISASVLDNSSNSSSCPFPVATKVELPVILYVALRVPIADTSNRH
jgi:hypothetical protein